jgi:threonine aldolase
VIDLRSDTVTHPTAGMRRAIANAVVGDEQKREDPTVLELERRAAALLGQAEAVYVPTATMANEIALSILSRPGDELIAEENAHLLSAELGGPAVFSGLMIRALPSERGRFGPEDIRAAFRRSERRHTPPTCVVAIENTHNTSGGRIWPLDEVAAVAQTCRELGLRLHLDGARLMNAAVATGTTPADYGGLSDTVTLCLSKGLGCPLGALVAGSSELMEEARHRKHRFGGAMRQAGIVAAAGVYALDHHVERLAEDHTRARRLAEGLLAAGVPIDLEQVETNFVQIDVRSLALGEDEALERLKAEGIGLSSTLKPGVLRAVTHLDIGDEDITRALEVIPRALGVPARV